MRENDLQSRGYNLIMGEALFLHDSFDPWGWGMEWMFALADVAFVEYGVCLPDYHPSPMLHSRSDLNEYTHEIILSFMDENLVDLEDIESVFTVLSRYDNWLRMAGMNY